MDKLESLEAAYKKENSRVAVRMLAVLMVLKDGKNIEHTAITLHRCTNWVRKWASHFEEHGLDGLYDLPKIWQTKDNFKEKNGLYNVKGNTNFVYSRNATANNFSLHRSQVSHKLHQKDNASVWHVCKICPEVSHQSCKHISCAKLATTHQRENFTPKRGRVCNCND